MTTNPIARMLAAVAAVACAFVAYATDYHAQRIEVPEDVISNNVNTIVKGSDGFIWFGSASGLVRYDGYGFLVYHPYDAPTSRPDYISAIAEDPRGCLWVRTDGSEFFRFDVATETFVADVDAKLREYGVESYPKHMLATSDKALWIFAGNGVYVLPANADKAVAIDIDDSFKCEELANVCVSDKYVAAVSRNGLVYVFDRASSSYKYTVDINSHHPLASQALNLAAYVDKDDRLWVWATSSLWVYDLRTGSFADTSVLTALLPGVYRAFVQDDKGRMWVARDHHGIDLVERAESGMALSPRQVDGIDNQSVTCLYQDDNGTIWIGTTKYGLYKCDAAASKFSLMSLPDVNVIAQGPGNTAWVGTDANWLYVWDYTRGTVRHVDRADKRMSDKAVTCLLDDGAGGVYVGCYEGGLTHVMSNGSERRYSMADGLLTDNVWALAIDRNRRLWVGTLGYGLQYLDEATGRFVSVGSSDSSDGANYISSLAFDKNGNLYIGTGYGITVLDAKSGEMRKIDQDIFASVHVNQVMIDSRGILWVATRNGLNYYVPETGKVGLISLGTSADNRHIHGVVQGSDGSIWASIGSMIGNIKIKDIAAGDYKVTIYNRGDGLLGSDYNQRSFAMLGSGIMACGGLHGITYFAPKDFEFNMRVPQVMFSALYINGYRIQPQQELDGRVVIDESLSRTPVINIPASAVNFVIHFATDQYSMPQKMTYMYRLEGGSDDWIVCQPGTNFVSYDKLPHGKYTLLVKAINADGVESGEPASISIVVHPPFWATIWAKLLYCLLAVALIYGIYYVVRRKERHIFVERQKQEEIEKQEQINQMKLRFFTNISHELRTPLTLIISPLERMLKEDNTPAQQQRLETMYRNANMLLNLVNQILDMRKIEMYGLKLNPRNADVMSVITLTASNFTAMAQSRNIRLSVKCMPERCNMEIDSDKIAKIVSNLISNSLKFTPDGGEIDVDAHVADGSLQLVVADTGIGIPEEEKGRIFERFYQSDNNNDVNTGTGIGLNMVWEYVHLHGGEITVADNPAGQGTVFTITIPIKQAERALVEDVVPAAAPEPAERDKDLILVVDDNPDITALLTDTLSEDYTVISASNGKSAWVKILEHKPTLVITDVMMPEVDGIELCRRIKSDVSTAAIPVIMLTAKNDISSTLQGLSIGADDYMTKPYNTEELLLRISKLIRLCKSGMHRALIEPKPSEIKISSVDEKLIGKAVEYVEANIGDPDLSVEMLSQHLGMSRVNLYKKMLNITGMPPIQFIRVMRLKRGAQLLRESQMYISEIAFSIGFSSAKYFSKYFKEEYGMSPSEYQQTYGK